MNLTTKYLGITLPHPLVVGASPLADHLDTVRRLEDAGAAAIVMRSLFEEQIAAEVMATYSATASHADSFVEARTYLPEPEDFVLGPQEYLNHLSQVKRAVRIPVFGSLNGTTPSGWLDYASMMQQAGADGLEINLYDVPMDPDDSAMELEQQAVEVIHNIKRSVQIPLAVKLPRFYTSLPHFARALVKAGADGLILFNRFYQPDIDVDNLEYISQLELSNPSELRLRLRWLAVLSSQLTCSLAVTGGVHTALDAIKAIMCGADAVQMVSALLRYGPNYLATVRRELEDWLSAREYDTLAQMRGSMNLARCPQPQLLYRANYIHLLQTWEAE
ncbi:MAG: Dihydroorotate dehydrogenase [Phycisphaerae bacterium]|nr:Dihydroorotate dehydrogenase [Phycisphaerae bacterium]